MRLTWSKQPSERGLASVCQAPRGANLKVNGIEIGAVRPKLVDWRTWDGWYWYARIPSSLVGGDEGVYHNSSDNPDETIEQAKVACETWVREWLQQAGKQ